MAMEWVAIAVMLGASGALAASSPNYGFDFMVLVRCALAERCATAGTNALSNTAPYNPQAVGPHLLQNHLLQPASRVSRRLLAFAAPPAPPPVPLSHPLAAPRRSAKFTIHGLWPNYANGGYPQDCVPSNTFSAASLPQPLLNQMSCEWVSYTGSNAAFWEYEWGKHGTCALSLLPTQEAFFNTSIALNNQFEANVSHERAGCCNSQGCHLTKAPPPTVPTPAGRAGRGQRPALGGRGATAHRAAEHLLQGLGCGPAHQLLFQVRRIQRNARPSSGHQGARLLCLNLAACLLSIVLQPLAQ
jgi:hypothetical protein